MSLFLRSKKRDLSDKSRNGENSKENKENSDSASSLPDDTFSDGFNLSECAKVLINWLYVLIMSRRRLRVNPHSIVAWMSRISFLENRREIWSLSDCNDSLAKWLSVPLRVVEVISVGMALLIDNASFKLYPR